MHFKALKFQNFIYLFLKFINKIISLEKIVQIVLQFLKVTIRRVLQEQCSKSWPLHFLNLPLQSTKLMLKNFLLSQKLTTVISWQK